MAAVRSLPHFPCSVCHATIVVPSTGPASVAPVAPAAAARPSLRPPGAQTLPPATPPRQAARRAAHPSKAKGPSSVLLAVVGGLAAVAVLAAFIALGGKDAPAPATPPKLDAAAPVAPKPDPDKDPAAWKALPPLERVSRTKAYVAGLDRRSESALRKGYDFLLARDEKPASLQVAQLAIDADPGCAWAHGARGETEILGSISQCLAQCARAVEGDTPGVQKLAAFRRQRQQGDGPWWADAPLAAQVESLLAQIREEEKALESPFNQAVAKWTLYQRRIEVMRDHPAITGTTGPYLLFVQIKAPAGTAADKVSADELDRAKRVLRQNQALFAKFYEGFEETLGAWLGVARYESSALDEKTLLKANIFADEQTWRLYHKRLYGTDAPGMLAGVRAYYSTEEPRFIVTYDGGDKETSLETDQVQCHEATHQFLHLCTWDVTRKATEREFPWLDCATRPPWLEEGFAEFFSAHRRDGGRCVWMQPLEGRMQESWVLSQVFAKKKWGDWTLEELISLSSTSEIPERALHKVASAKGGDAPGIAALAAPSLYTSSLYGRSWSLVYFLWNASGPDGKPKWRDGFQKLMRQSLRVDLVPVTIQGPPRHVLTAADFRRALGLTDDAAFQAFEREWLASEARLLAKNKSSSWETHRDQLFAKLGIR